ncbi:MAG: hypothetical protein ACOYM9_12990 [Bradymonadia bacterium]
MSRTLFISGVRVSSIDLSRLRSSLELGKDDVFALLEGRVQPTKAQRLTLESVLGRPFVAAEVEGPPPSEPVVKAPRARRTRSKS